MSYYHHQSILLASKHQKEQAIAPVFAKKLGCSLNIHEFDTDQFGTFTGEVPRAQSPYETCVLKAKTAADHYGYRLALASEGSFGPHPQMPFVASDHEIMVLVDREQSWVIAEQCLSTETNYAMLTLNAHTDWSSFLDQVHFPSHALTLQTAKDKQLIAKGIQTFDELEHWIHHGLTQDDELLLGTDMRAMMNPTRMALIECLAQKLADRILSRCPQCASPGFGGQSQQGHLPCSCCGSPTNFYQHEVWGCVHCDHQEYRPRQDGLQDVDPTYCSECNP